MRRPLDDLNPDPRPPVLRPLTAAEIRALAPEEIAWLLRRDKE